MGRTARRSRAPTGSCAGPDAPRSASSTAGSPAGAPPAGSSRPARPPAAAFRPATRGEEVETDAGWIAGTFAQAGVQLLDVRDVRGWERWETPPTFAAGHIPYSLPFDPRPC